MSCYRALYLSWYYSEKERLKYSFYWFPTKRDYFLITIHFRETSTKKLHNFIWRLMATVQLGSGFQEYDEGNFAFRKIVSIWIVISRSNLKMGILIWNWSVDEQWQWKCPVLTCRGCSVTRCGSDRTLLLGWLVTLVTGCLKMEAVCLMGKVVFKSGFPC